VIPVVLTYAQTSPDNHDMQPLLKAGLKLENSIVIVNGVNDTLRHIYTVPEINNYFREYRECGFFKGSRAVRFVMFLPTLKQTVNVESMGPQQIEQFYNDLPDKEMQDLQDYLNSKDVDGDYFGLDASVTSAFGVSSAHQALLDVLQNWTESNGEKTAHVLQDRLAPVAAQRRRIEAEIGKRKVRLAETETIFSAYAEFQEKLEKVLDTTGLQEQLDNKKVQERKIKEVIRTLSVNLYSSFTQQMARI
jgi:hypothetical protein